MKKITVLAISICTLVCTNAFSMNEDDKNNAKKNTRPSMILTPPGTYSNFPLHWAAARGDIAFVSTAIFTGAQDPNELDSEKRLPIQYAKANGHTEIVDVLSREAKESLLHQKTLTMIAQPANLQAAQSNTQSATSTASISSLSSESSQLNIELAEEKFDTQGALCPDSPSGRYPLHWAAAHGYYQQVMLLIYNKNQAIQQNPNQRDNYGRTPLHYAAANGHHDIVTFLVYNLQKSHGGEYRLYNTSPLDDYNFTPLMYAHFNQQHDVINAFFRRGSNRNAMIAHEEITTITRAYGLDANTVKEQYPYLTLEQIQDEQSINSTPSQSHREIEAEAIELSPAQHAPASSMSASASYQVTTQEPTIQLEARTVNQPSNWVTIVDLSPSLVEAYNQRAGSIGTHASIIQNQAQVAQATGHHHRSHTCLNNWWCWFGCTTFCVAASGISLLVASANGSL